MLKYLICVYVIMCFTSEARVFNMDYDRGVNIDKLPAPEDMVFKLSENEYDEYVDFYLHQQFLNKNQFKERLINENDGCVISLRNLKEPTPIFATEGRLLRPGGTTGNIVLKPSQSVEASCTGFSNGLDHDWASNNPTHTTLKCQRGFSMTSPWISGTIDFDKVQCIRRTNFTTIRTDSTCLGGGQEIISTLTVGDQRFTLFKSCLHESRSEVLYVSYLQNPENVYSQPNVARPGFYQGTHFPNLNVDRLYSQNSQKYNFDEILGPSMNEKYINATFFLSRGHLAARTDFIMAAEQRASFTFVNAAPQWQSFNGGNWNVLEQRLRSRIATAGYRTIIFTGTLDVLRLRDSSGDFKEIYLSANTQQIPVPLWFYKVVYEPASGRGVVFIGLNNPHISLSEARDLAFCSDVCNDNPDFSWLNWRSTDIRRGYSICCEVDDFRRTVSILPYFTTMGILS